METIGYLVENKIEPVIDEDSPEAWLFECGNELAGICSTEQDLADKLSKLNTSAAKYWNKRRDDPPLFKLKSDGIYFGEDRGFNDGLFYHRLVASVEEEKQGQVLSFSESTNSD